MLKKDHDIKWTVEAKKYFKNIKQAISEAPMLVSPYFDKEFLVFSYDSKHIVVVVLLQKNDQGEEQPIAFFSKMLKDAELNYHIMEKQAYDLIKALKYFRIYILH